MNNKIKTSKDFQFVGINLYVKDPANAGLFVEDKFGFEVLRHHYFLGEYNVYTSITNQTQLRLKQFTSQPTLPVSFSFKPIKISYKDAIIKLQNEGFIHEYLLNEDVENYPKQMIPIDGPGVFFLENISMAEEIYKTEKQLFKKYGLQQDSTSFYDDYIKYSLLNCRLDEIQLKIFDLKEGIRLFDDILGYPLIEGNKIGSSLINAKFLMDARTNLKFNLFEKDLDHLSHDMRKNVRFVLNTGLNPSELKDFFLDYYESYFLNEKSVNDIKKLEKLYSWQINLNGLQWLLLSDVAGTSDEQSFEMNNILFFK